MAYQLSGQSKYADKAKYFLMAWANINTSYSGTDGTLVTSYAGPGLLIGADLLWPYSGWAQTDKDKFKTWTINVYKKAANSIAGKSNNWGDWGVYGSMLSAYLLDDTSDMNARITRLKSLIDSQIASDGHMPEETGRQQRGLWYTYFALAPMTAGAQVAYNATGTNLFTYTSPNGKTIKKALDFLLYYVQNPSGWPYYGGTLDLPNPTASNNWPYNLFEAMTVFYSDADYSSYVSANRPFMNYGHHYAWTFPTLMKKANIAVPAGVIIDNTSSNFSTTGTWITSTNISGYYGSNYLIETSTNTTATAKWTSPITTTGTYDVYMRWTSASTRPDAAPVLINYNGGLDSVTVNQRVNGDTWVKIGTWSFTGGSGDYVMIKTTDAGDVVADAVQWLPAGSPAPLAAVANQADKLSLINTETENFNPNLVVYPNPATKAVTLSFASKAAGRAAIELYNSLGQQQLSVLKPVSIGANSINLNLNNTPMDVYRIRVRVGDKIMVQELVVN